MRARITARPEAEQDGAIVSPMRSRLLTTLSIFSLGLIACSEAGPDSGSGGSPGAGGDPATGGAGVGGTPEASGGAPTSGGAPAGGAPSIGGNNTGGDNSGASGGEVSAGGAPAGGAPSTGGGAQGSGGSQSDEFLLSGPAWEGVNNDDCTPETPEPCPTYPLESTNFGSPQKNVSPEISWSGVPEGTMSFALVLSDLTNGMAHWVLYDIPASVTMLPKGLPSGSPLQDPAGAKQVSFAGASYFGSGACGNVYEHRLYALGDASLSPAMTSASAARTAVQNADVLGETFIRLQSRDCN